MKLLKRIRTAFFIGIELFFASIYIYLIFGLFALLIPIGEIPTGNNPIYVRSNGIHTDILIPVSQLEGSSVLVPFHGRILKDDYLAIGWGERAFYIETPTWAKVSMGTVLNAMMLPSRAALHAEAVKLPKESEKCKKLMVSDAQLAIILKEIETLQDKEGFIHIPGVGYDKWDEFFEAKGSYTAVSNCNDWTGMVLRKAGIKVPLWTPFAFSVMHYL